MTNRQLVVVQGSSRAWGGGADVGMSVVEGEPVIAVTLRRVADAFPDADLCLVAPAFDAGGEMDAVLRRALGGRPGRAVYAFDDSPLDRLLAAASHLPDEAHLLRFDGPHFCCDVDAGRAMLEQARVDDLDCVKFPDDFPSTYQCEVYRIGALRKAASALVGELLPFRIHPKFFFASRKELFRTAYHQPKPYPPSRFEADRAFSKRMYHVDQIEITPSRIWTGDQLSFHYELASQRVKPTDVLLDIACGDGFGLTYLAGRVARVVGADIDEAKIEIARTKNVDFPNVTCEVGDVTALDMPDNTFDMVTSFETLEHVDGDAFFRELMRVLKPGGRLMLSTPQNSTGDIPVTPFHVHEYSLEQLLALCERYGSVIEVLGIKAGRIVIPGDPRGANSVVVCQRVS